MSFKNEQMASQKICDELRAKVKVLEAHRQEDREKLKELERLKLEAEQLSIAKAKLAARVSELQQELRDANKALAAADDKEGDINDKHADLLEQLEMMTVDKEMAEEKMESLKMEVDALKDKVEELSLDLEVYKHEDELASSGVPVEVGKAPVEIVQLEKQNERLKEALVRMRDITNEQEAELQKKVKSLESELHALQDVASVNEKLVEKVDAYVKTVDELKAQLDDALAFEDLVTELTDRNLAKSEKIEELKAIVEDLEALKELNDELEENHVETEKQMQADIEQLNAVVREQRQQLELAEEAQADHENTIAQFRELVRHLQSDIEQLRQHQVSHQDETKTLSSQSQLMLRINMRLQASVGKAKAKSIDLELRKLDALQAAEHLAYVKPYLPEAFRIEEQPIQCLLLFKRLAFKFDLILRHLEMEANAGESTVVPANDMSTNSTLFEVQEKLAELSQSARRFVVFMTRSSMENFFSLGSVYHDLVGMERNLDGLLELQRKQEFKAREALEILNRSIAHLDRLATQHVNTEDPAISSHDIESLVRVAEYRLDHIFANVEGIVRTVENAVGASETNAAKAEQELLAPLRSAMKTAKSCKVQTRKLWRHVLELQEAHFHIQPVVLKDSRAVFTRISQLLGISNELCTSIMILADNHSQPVTFAQLDEALISSAKGVEAVSSLDSVFATIFNELNAVYAATDNADNAQKAETLQEPWIMRAALLKKTASVNAETERKLKALDEEIKQLLTGLKLKDQVVQEATVKIALLENRLEAAKHQADTISRLETELSKLKHQEKILEEAVDNLQSEVEVLESENMQLKKLVRKADKPTPFASLRKSSSADTDGELLGGDDGQLPHNAALRIEHLQSAVRYLRSEINALRSRLCCPDVDDIASVTSSSYEYHAQVMKTASEVTSLLKDIWSASGSVKVVNLAASAPADGSKRLAWRSFKLHPDYQHRMQVSVMNSLFRRGEALRNEMGGHLTKAAANRCTTDAASPYIGRVRMPAIPNVPPRRRCVRLGSYAEMRTVHDCFVK